jgi:predicted nucleotidyltransferase
MRLEELINPEDVDLTFEYHTELNPAIWEGYKLRSDVASKLLEIADLFSQFLELPNLEIVDIIFTGSNANFNWTKYSDVDLHIVVDFSSLAGDDLLSEYLQAKKKIWNDMHTITIRGFSVELYAQDKDENHIATGVYSLLKKKWNIFPKYEKQDIDSNAVRAKAADFMNQIDELVDEGCIDTDSMDKLKHRIRTMRKAGLEQAGEFSTENLTFKILRNSNYLEKLSQCQLKSLDTSLSIEEELFLEEVICFNEKS